MGEVEVVEVVPPFQCRSCKYVYEGDYYEVGIGSFGVHLFFSKPIKTVCCERGRHPTWIGAQQEFYVRNLPKREEAKIRASGSFMYLSNPEGYLNHYGKKQKPCGWFKSKISGEE